MEVTTLENEIGRQRKIAELLEEFAKLSGDPDIFNATTMAKIHRQTANRLQELKQKMI